MTEISKEFLLSKVSRNSSVVAELKNSSAWRIIVEDYEEAKRRADDAWAFIPESEPEKLRELKITKLAIAQVLNLLSNYEHDLLKAQEQLSKVDSPEELYSQNYGETK